MFTSTAKRCLFLWNCQEAPMDLGSLFSGLTGNGPNLGWMMDVIRLSHDQGAQSLTTSSRILRLSL